MWNIIQIKTICHPTCTKSCVQCIHAPLSELGCLELGCVFKNCYSTSCKSTKKLWNFENIQHILFEWNLHTKSYL